MSQKSKVLVVMGSLSDYPVVENAEKMLKKLKVEFSTQIVSAHRTPHEMIEVASHARGKGFQVIIAAAGGAAHLPGMVASASTLPVIGIPILSERSLGGLDSLLSIVQMPAGVPVATVGVNAAENAAILAAQIISSGDPAVQKALEEFKAENKEKVKRQNSELSGKSS